MGAGGELHRSDGHRRRGPVDWHTSNFDGRHRPTLLLRSLAWVKRIAATILLVSTTSVVSRLLLAVPPPPPVVVACRADGEEGLRHHEQKDENTKGPHYPHTASLCRAIRNDVSKSMPGSSLSSWSFASIVWTARRSPATGHFDARKKTQARRSPSRITTHMRNAWLALLLIAVSAVAAEDTRTVVARDGVELHYTVVGDRGPYAVILSGGPGEEVSSMAGVAEHLRQHYRCVMLEQRGTGRSHLTAYDRSTINLDAYIEDIEVLRKHLGVDKLVVVGNSWGMMLALAYGGAHPAAAQAIVTLGSGPISPSAPVSPSRRRSSAFAPPLRPTSTTATRRCATRRSSGRPISTRACFAHSSRRSRNSTSVRCCDPSPRRCCCCKAGRTWPVKPTSTRRIC